MGGNAIFMPPCFFRTDNELTTNGIYSAGVHESDDFSAHG
jgi:hypothetical protein